MHNEDAQRWNRRYQEDPRFISVHPNSLLIEYGNLLKPNGLALDLAMGTGGNANYLIKHGIRVIGVDISAVAVKKGKALSPELQAVIADLEYFFIPNNTFDIIINFLYLQRNLWLPMVHGLKINGFIFVEYITEEMLKVNTNLNPHYLVESGELKQFFSTPVISNHLELIYSHEGWQSNASHPRIVASLIARRYA